MILSQFHRDILYLIFSRVDFDSSRTLRLVCKRFRDLITIPWIESSCLVHHNNYYEEWTSVPNGRHHGESIRYALDLETHQLVVTDICSYKYGLLDGPYWHFSGPSYTSYTMYRRGYYHGICAKWMPGHTDVWMEFYFWGYRIPEGESSIQIVISMPTNLHTIVGSRPTNAGLRQEDL